MDLKKYLPFAIAILAFVLVALAYFSPVLEGKKLFQSDIAQFRGMSKEVQEFRQEYGEEPYWTNRAFGGMPTYQLSTYYPHDYIKKIDSVLRFLPRPADYLFLYFLGFFILLLALKIDWELAVVGALGFGLSTYLIIILGVGHNAKAHAIAYMPMVLAGVLLVFNKKYLLGFVVTTLSMALEVNASHPQMTYYLLFTILIFGVVYLIEAMKQKNLKSFAINVGILSVAMILALGVNATSLLATKEYANFSTRSASELTINPDGSAKEPTSGLDRSYITEYSYGIAETLDLFIPRFYGGSNNEKLDKESYTYRFLKDKAGRKQALNFAENAPMYWGDQPIVAAPAYVGAIFIFLFVMGIFLVKSNLKKWLVAATIFSILLSWGKNLGFLTDLFIDYVPMYNKFRAVSSIQVIAEICIPVLAILTLQKFLDKDVSKEDKFKAFKYGFAIVGGTALLFTIGGANLLTFESFRDASYENMVPGFTQALIEDRRTIFFQDSLRSLLLVIGAALVLYLSSKNKLSRNITLSALLVLVLIDMAGVAKRYVNDDDFVSKRQIETPFAMSSIDQEIIKDEGHYRVLNFTVNPMNDGSTSFYHNSIGGYHAAKPRRYQELFDFQIAKNNIEVFNMLNAKYIIFPDQNNQAAVQLNPDANGNAWFVSGVKFVTSANEEIKALDSLNTKDIAVINVKDQHYLKEFQFKRDSAASITLKHYKANELVYESHSKVDQLAMFSEIFYPHGWNAYIDGELHPHFRANYVLRAMEIPKGKHTIEFKFEPQVIQMGSTIVLISFGLMILIPFGWYLKNKKDDRTS